MAEEKRWVLMVKAGIGDAGLRSQDQTVNKETACDTRGGLAVNRFEQYIGTAGAYVIAGVWPHSDVSLYCRGRLDEKDKATRMQQIPHRGEK